MKRESAVLMLSPEQTRKVEENHNLIYSFLHKHNLPEDMYSAAGIGLCKAAASFDENRGCAFSSYAYSCMYNECRRYWREERKQTALSPLSLDEPQTVEDEDFCLGSMVKGVDVIEEAEVCDFVAWFIKDASTNDLLIILRLLQRETQVEIAKEMGCSRARVGARLKKIRSMYSEGRSLSHRKGTSDPSKDRILKQEILRAMRCDP